MSSSVGRVVLELLLLSVERVFFKLSLSVERAVVLELLLSSADDVVVILFTFKNVKSFSIFLFAIHRQR